MANNNSSKSGDPENEDSNNVHQHKKVNYECGDDSAAHGEHTSSAVEPCTSTSEPEFSKNRIQYSKLEIYSYCDTHFAILPEELLVEILRYVAISDLWNFCKAFKDVEHLLKEQALTRNINLNGWYDVNTNSIFLNINPENVTTLNLNYCPWLPREGLLSFVEKCANLKTLLALGTKLGLSDEDIQSYNKTKINKLAVTINKHQIIARTAILGSVTYLALELLCFIFDVCATEEFARIFPTTLQKVWVDGISSRSCVEWICKWLKTYKSSGEFQEQIYYPSRTNLNSNIFALTEITRDSNFYLSYIGMKDYDQKVVCFENINNPTLPYVRLDTEPYGRKVAKLLHSGEKTLETIQFEELNFNQSIYYHVKKCKKAYRQLLMAPNARNIKKLTLCVCLFDDYKEDNNPVNGSISVLKEFSNLRFLQLFHCKLRPYLRDLQGYDSLGNLTKLRYLFVEIPENCDGKFLFDVLKNCSQLETLHTKSLDYNTYNCSKSNVAVINHIFKGLEYATNLKELILEKYVFLNIDNLLSLLIQLKKIKLQKLSLNCEYAGRFEEIFDECLRLYPDRLQRDYDFHYTRDYMWQRYLKRIPHHLEFFSLDLLSKYMHLNPQLVDCRIAISRLNNAQIELIKQKVSEFNADYRYFNIGHVGETSRNDTLSRFDLMEDVGTF